MIPRQIPTMTPTRNVWRAIISLVVSRTGRQRFQVALWVTEMESCQGYHDGTVKYGWLAASCLNNAAEQRMLAGVVPVEPVQVRVSILSRRASINRRAAPDSAAAVVAGAFGCPVAAQTGRPRRGRGVSGRTEKAGRWTEHGTNVAKWEAGKANGPWEGCWSHRADRGLDHAQSAGSWVARIPCRGVATKMRVQGGVVAPCFAQLRVCLSGRCVVWCGVN